MTDACTITVPGSATWDEVTATSVPGSPVSVYSGRCRVQLANVQEQETSAGEAAFTVQSATVQLPVDGTGAVPVGALVTVTASLLDASLVGRTYKVVALHAKSQATSRRLRVAEVTG